LRDTYTVNPPPHRLLIRTPFQQSGGEPRRPKGRAVYRVLVPGLREHLTSQIGKFKSDGVTERLEVYELTNLDDLEIFLQDQVSSSSGGGVWLNDANSAAISLLYSVIATKGIKQIKSEMDGGSCELIGAHGYCTQEMVNLLIFGSAVSNTFDHDLILDSQGGTSHVVSKKEDEDTAAASGSDDVTVLKGVPRRSEIGLLSLFDHYKSCTVGEHLKTPVCPVWLICSESHFTVAFSEDPLCVNSSVAERRPVHLYYYDQLANQTELIKLTLKMTSIGSNDDKDDDGSSSASSSQHHLVSPIEHCLRTKWTGAQIDWNGTEPLL